MDLRFDYLEPRYFNLHPVDGLMLGWVELLETRQNCSVDWAGYWWVVVCVRLCVCVCVCAAAATAAVAVVVLYACYTLSLSV